MTFFFSQCSLKEIRSYFYVSVDLKLESGSLEEVEKVTALDHEPQLGLLFPELLFVSHFQF